MFFIKLIIIYIVLLLIPVYISTAATEGIHLGPAILKPAVSLDWTYNDNYQSQEKNKESAYYLNVGPSMELIFEKGENKFSIEVISPVRYFSEATEKKTRFQDTFYSTTMEIRLPWRSYLKVYDSFTGTEFSPFLTETESNKNSDRLENHARFTLGTNIGDIIKLEGNYRTDFYKFKDKEKNLIFTLDRNNHKVDNFRGLIVLNILSRDSLMLNYSYQTDKYENDPSRDNKSLQYDFGFFHRFKNILSLSGRLGLGNSIREGLSEKLIPMSESDTLSWGSTVDIKITDKTSMNFSVSKSTTETSLSKTAAQISETSEEFNSSKNRSLSFFFDLKSSITDRTDVTLSARRTSSNSSLKSGRDTIYNDIYINIDQKFFEKMVLNFNVSYKDNEFKEGANEQFVRRNNREKRWTAGGDISFKIFKHATTEISFNHQERNSTFGDYTKNIISLRMNISY